MTDILRAVREAVERAGMPPTRVFRDYLAQGAPLPALVLTLIDDPSSYGHDGPSGLAEARVQFDVYADSDDAASAAMESIRKAISGVASIPTSYGTLEGPRKISERSFFDPAIRKPRRSMDMLIFHTEEV